MFLHLGGEVVVHIDEIIAIFDIHSTSKSKISRSFLDTCMDEGFVVEISKEEPRAFVITEKVVKSKKPNKTIIKTVIYYSPISAHTLQKRAGYIDDID
ncbi:extracellular matrix regulator RemB [Alkaliphilus serpentinus]|uniref:DUF370 domain-containing protein n=1 Tax=Alkaliphilus serpentinus TaxID=1482731 RepID=A0A833M8A7_9FIRM|nr:extracellular matrix/biofilm biosynthesis regulator RemA family protein [Alkaliphilus serpentinus]KAB3532225.1 DUF370 domain-containing protein [Alkaliphilus serpentinus]